VRHLREGRLMRLIYFPNSLPKPFTIALSGTTVDDFGNQVHLEGNAQWFAAANFSDENYFDASTGFGPRGWREAMNK
jgi:hypothetical protein